MSGFMEEQVTHLMDWWQVDGRAGTAWFPCDDFTEEEAAEAYELPQGIKTISSVTGYGARLSADGYLDCTEWCVFDTEQEAAEYLRDTFGDDEEGDMEG